VPIAALLRSSTQRVCADRHSDADWADEECILIVEFAKLEHEQKKRIVDAPLRAPVAIATDPDDLLCIHSGVRALWARGVGRNWPPSLGSAVIVGMLRLR